MTDVVTETRVPDRYVRVVVAVTLVVGALLLSTTIGTDQSTAQFVGTGLALGAVWLLGFLAARRFRRLRIIDPGRHALFGLGVGVAAFVVFVGIGWLARQLSILDEPIDDILRTADVRARVWVHVVAIVNAVTEELFFRGALVDALPRRYAAVGSTVIYVVVTTAGGNVALALAAMVIGGVFVVTRLRSGSLIAPIAAHVTWSVLVITLFPRT